MRAFLSHSSKDKDFVRLVAQQLGTVRCEYDEYTFEFVLNTQAIRSAFQRADVFVLFLSANSIKSTFVNEEMSTALDYRAQGKIRRVLIFSVDETSYSVLPEWLRSINVVIKAASPKIVARFIESELFAIAAESEKGGDIYIPRTDEEKSLRKILSQAPGKAPVALHVVGHLGLGRRTFLKKVLTSLFPRQIKAFVQISLGRFEGVNEFYRRLYDHYRIASLEDKIDHFIAFSQMTEDRQVEEIVAIMLESVVGDEFIVVDDEGAVLADGGDYQTFFASMIDSMKDASRPVIGFATSRMMPLHIRDKRQCSYFAFLSNLNDDQLSELMSFSLRDAEIDFSDSQLRDLCLLLDGHPYNARLAVSAVKNYGIDSFLEDPSYLIGWKRRRAEDFLARIKFGDIERDILSLLHDYRYLSFSLLRSTLEFDPESLASSLRGLEEYCCIERIGTLYSIALPINDAIGRDVQFEKKDTWKLKAAEIIKASIEEYKGEDHIPIALLDAGALASLRSGTVSGRASVLILPSHYLALARNAYDDDRRKDCLSFAKKAFDQKARLSVDGQVEALRLWGLAAIRLSEEDELSSSLSALEEYSSRTARRHALFLEGFRLRSRKRYDEAETKFLAAYRLAPKNHSINRELANLYRHQKEFAVAEVYARQAYEIAPTNAFIIDIFLETLLGKMHIGLEVDQAEVGLLFRELERYGDVPGSSFYQIRVAQDLLRQNRTREALSATDAALDRTPNFLPGYFLRADIRLSLADGPGARKDLLTINRLLDKRGGFSQEDEARTVEIEIRLLIEERKFSKALETLTRSQFIRKRTFHNLSRTLSLAIKLEPAKADQETLSWAERQTLSGNEEQHKQLSPATRSKRPRQHRSD